MILDQLVNFMNDKGFPTYQGDFLTKDKSQITFLKQGDSTDYVQITLEISNSTHYFTVDSMISKEKRIIDGLKIDEFDTYITSQLFSMDEKLSVTHNCFVCGKKITRLDCGYQDKDWEGMWNDGIVQNLYAC